MLQQPVHFPILKRRPEYKVGNKASDYRSAVREDCQRRCVYCDGHENEIGGRSNMTLDHFRPKGIEEYRDLRDDPLNLHYACHPCNTFKADDWPALGTDLTVSEGAGYIDPFSVDRNDYFAISDDGALDALQAPGEYMLRYLSLNRHFLRLLRLKRDLSYSILSSLFEFFATEAGTYEKMLENPDITDSQAIDIRVELQRIEGIRNSIDVFSKLHELS